MQNRMQCNPKVPSGSSISKIYPVMRRCALNINLTKINLTKPFWELKEGQRRAHSHLYGLREDQREFFVSYKGREHRMCKIFYKLKVDISTCFGNRKINTIKNARGASSVE